MTLGIVSSDRRKCPIIVMKEKEKVDSLVYQKYFKKHFLPWLRKEFPDGNYVFQQDGARCHMSRLTCMFLDTEGVKYSMSMWPPGSPDLNAIWSHMSRNVNKKRHTSLESLKKAIKKEWRSMNKQFIIKVCGCFRSRLEHVLEGGGGNLSH